jgi:hypothetical protein
MLFALLPIFFALMGAAGLIGMIYQHRKLHRDAANDAFEAFTARGRRKGIPAKRDRPS